MRRQIVQAAALATIAIAVLIAVALSIHWFPVAADTEAHKIDTLYYVLIIVSVPIFVMVLGVVLFSVKHFRMRPGQELQDGPPIHGNTKLEVVWTTIPALLLIALCVYAYVVLTDIEKKDPKRMFVTVTGQQFAWSYEYTQPGGKKVKTDQLYLPVDHQVQFDLKALDVIHDYWVPAFRLKSDAVPGITTHYVVTPNRVGTYPAVCAELCGLGHATMRSTVHVIAQDKFNKWLAAQKSSAGDSQPQ